MDRGADTCRAGTGDVREVHHAQVHAEREFSQRCEEPRCGHRRFPHLRAIQGPRFLEDAESEWILPPIHDHLLAELSSKLIYHLRILAQSPRPNNTDLTLHF